MPIVIGREAEKKELQRIESSKEAELVAVYGRRRVGKTFLIRNGFTKPLSFELTGMHQASHKEQLENFAAALSNAYGTGLPVAPPASWLEAFRMLKNYLEPLIRKSRTVIFIDEFPWIASPRSGFLSAFEHFWNTWASQQEKLVVVICGSAASWMINKIINNRGGLHNRVTKRIRLLPFTIGETEAYLKKRKIRLDRFQILQLYMAMGGIPQYLKEVTMGESTAQTIDRLCFTKDGILQDEFSNLYHSLFDKAEYHLEVVRALAAKGNGMTRTEIITVAKLNSGGHVTRLLNELSESGFISSYIPFGKTSKDLLYRLTDEYSLFYLKFIENSRATGAGTWLRSISGRSWPSWSGIAFEGICLKHIPQLKKAMGIEAVYSEESVWRHRPRTPDDKGAQIDLIIDRADHSINLCEMKFSEKEFEISKSYAAELAGKESVFRAETKTKKSTFITLVTTFGVKTIDKYPGLIQQEISMDVLFV